MAANIGEIRSKVQTRIRDDVPHLSLAEIAGDVDQAIISALAEYQIARPRQAVVKPAGSGAFDYALPGSFLGFVDGFSSFIEIAYPYVVTQPEPTIIDPVRYGIVRLDTGLFLRFFDATPQASEFFLATFTVPHSLTDAASTVPSTDDEALADLGASFGLLKLAVKYAQDNDASMQADAVDRRSKPDIYRSLAGDYRKRFEQKLQVGAAHGPASTIDHVERRFGNQQRTRFFFHTR